MAAIDADCITHRQLIPWADCLVAEFEKPPVWICDLAVTKYKPDVLRVVREYVYSEPFEEFPDEDRDYVGFLWVRYERREISWATFLTLAGSFTDASRGPLHCEYFYSLLNNFEEKHFAHELELIQVASARSELSEAIVGAKVFYDAFLKTG